MLKVIGTSIIACLALSGCRFGCEVEKVATQGISAAVVTTLQCTNLDAVQKDIGAIVKKVGICEKQGPIAQLVCPMVSKLVVSQLANQVPDEWNCKMENATQTLDAIVLQACLLLPI